MSAPLYNKIMKYSKEVVSFHMPGHKYGRVFNMKEMDFLKLDVTEVPGLDNLYEAEEVILKAQEKMAKKYGAKESIFITNGSTSGITASILTVCKPGDSLIIARNSHHSVWNSLILGGIKPIYINPKYHEQHNILGGICPIELDQLLLDYPEAKGVIIVSPTYEGLVSDIKEIANIVHKHNKILIVDEAHGAHFIWDDSFPKSAIEEGADIIVQSMHKTLPALTQSAVVHIGSNRINKETLLKRLQMTQTSSPSYVMMGIMDYMRAEMEEKRSLWEDYIRNLQVARQKMSQLKNLSLLSKSILGEAGIHHIDESKLVIFTYQTNITGIELSKILREKYHIQVEVETDEYIIAMSTIGDTACDLELLSNALLEIDDSLEKKEKIIRPYEAININDRNSMIPREIYFGEKEDIPLEKCKGRISATNIMLYPPGIPLVCIGEIFSNAIIDRIKILEDRLLGITSNHNQIMISVLKEGEKNGR